jgi:hypothetical protein
LLKLLVEVSHTKFQQIIQNGLQDNKNSPVMDLSKLNFIKINEISVSEKWNH